MNFKNEFDLAKKTALEVGKFLKLQTVKKINSQNGKDIKLELDKKSEEMIIEKLTKDFDYSLLSEEIGLTKKIEDNKPYWIVDPIDGTLNFSRNNPTSCISIALWVNKDPIIGVIYDFNRNELFSGYVGVGAWLNETKLKSQKKKKKSQSILATGFSTYLSIDDNAFKTYAQLLQDYKKVRMIGSAALSLAYVACGRFDSYMENKIKFWDIAAGIAINSAINHLYDIEFLKEYLTITKVSIY